jgi:hypothetical protein
MANEQLELGVRLLYDDGSYTFVQVVYEAPAIKNTAMVWNFDNSVTDF